MACSADSTLIYFKPVYSTCIEFTSLKWTRLTIACLIVMRNDPKQRFTLLFSRTCYIYCSADIMSFSRFVNMLRCFSLIQLIMITYDEFCFVNACYFIH